LRQELVGLHRRIERIDDDVALVVENFLELLEREIDEGPDAARQGLYEPDVRDRRRELDMAHALAAHLALDDFDAAFPKADAAVPHALVLAAVALVVLGRFEDLRAEQAC